MGHIVRNIVSVGVILAALRFGPDYVRSNFNFDPGQYVQQKIADMVPSVNLNPFGFLADTYHAWFPIDSSASAPESKEPVTGVVTPVPSPAQNADVWHRMRTAMDGVGDTLYSPSLELQTTILSMTPAGIVAQVVPQTVRGRIVYDSKAPLNVVIPEGKPYMGKDSALIMPLDADSTLFIDTARKVTGLKLETVISNTHTAPMTVYQISDNKLADAQSPILPSQSRTYKEPVVTLSTRVQIEDVKFSGEQHTVIAPQWAVLTKAADGTEKVIDYGQFSNSQEYQAKLKEFLADPAIIRAASSGNSTTELRVTENVTTTVRIELPDLVTYVSQPPLDPEYSGFFETAGSLSQPVTGVKIIGAGLDALTDVKYFVRARNSIAPTIVDMINGSRATGSDMPGARLPEVRSAMDEKPISVKLPPYMMDVWTSYHNTIAPQMYGGVLDSFFSGLLVNKDTPRDEQDGQSITGSCGPGCTETRQTSLKDMFEATYRRIQYTDITITMPQRYIGAMQEYLKGKGLPDYMHINFEPLGQSLS